MSSAVIIAFVIVFSYLFGSIPFSFLIAKVASGKDLTKVGTGNIGAMNVRRATGSWAWFIVAMILDGLKGFFPVILSRYLSFSYGIDPVLLKGLALNFAVIGHNFSFLAYRLTGKITSGRGLATGGGGLLAYNPLYLLIALLIGLPAIFLSRFLLVGQILTPVLLPVIIYFVNKKDFLPILFVCIIVIIRHLERIPSLLSGREPEFYVDEKNKPKD